MAKIKIDLDPQGPITFEREVSIPTPSGKVLKVPFTFRHRTREEMAALTDGYIQQAREQFEKMQQTIAAERAASKEAEAEGRVYVPPFKPTVDGVDDGLKSDVRAVMDAATGWGLAEYEFNAENIEKFLRLYAGAATAIASDYRKSMTEGRLGN